MLVGHNGYIQFDHWLSLIWQMMWLTTPSTRRASTQWWRSSGMPSMFKSNCWRGPTQVWSWLWAAAGRPQLPTHTAFPSGTCWSMGTPNNKVDWSPTTQSCTWSVTEEAVGPQSLQWASHWKCRSKVTSLALLESYHNQWRWWWFNFFSPPAVPTVMTVTRQQWLPSLASSYQPTTSGSFSGCSRLWIRALSFQWGKR